MTNLEIRAESIYNLIKTGLENQFDSRLAKLEIETELQKTVRETLEVMKQGIEEVLSHPKTTSKQPEPVREPTSVTDGVELPKGYKFSVARQGWNIVRGVDLKVIKSFPHHVMKNLKEEDFKRLLSIVFSDLELETNQFLIDLTMKLEIPNGFYLRVKRFTGEEFDSLILWSADYYLKKVDRKNIVVLMSPFKIVRLNKLWVHQFQRKINKAFSKEVALKITEWDKTF